MPVQPEDLVPLPVEEEPVDAEHRLAEPNSHGHRVRGPARRVHGHPYRVQPRRPGRPQPHRADPAQLQPHRVSALGVHHHVRGGHGNSPGPVHQRRGHPDPPGRPGRIQRGRHPHAAAVRQHVHRPGEHVGQVDLGDHAQPDVTVDPAGLQPVHAPRPEPGAGRRHRQPAVVDDDRQQVLAGPQVLGQFGGPAQVAALVGAHHVAVEHHRGAGHHPVEVEQNPAAGRPPEVLAVDPHVLPARRVPPRPGQRGDRVRHRDRVEAALVEAGLLRPRGIDPAEQPAPVEVVLPAGRRVRLDVGRQRRAAGQHRGDRGGREHAGAQHRTPGHGLAGMLHHVVERRIHEPQPGEY